MHGVQLKQFTEGEEKEKENTPHPETVGAPASSSSGNGSPSGVVGDIASGPVVNIVITDNKKKTDMHDIDKNIAEGHPGQQGAREHHRQDHKRKEN